MTRQEMKENNSMKVKFPKPKIICKKYSGKKYYSIKNYDVFAEEFMIGFGSYEKKYVKKWLRNEFVIVTKLDLKEHSCTKN